MQITIEHIDTSGKKSTTIITASFGQLIATLPSIFCGQITPNTTSVTTAPASPAVSEPEEPKAEKPKPAKTEKAPKAEKPKPEPKPESDPLEDLIAGDSGGFTAEDMRSHVLHAAGKLGARPVANLLKEVGGSERITQVPAGKFAIVKAALDKALADAGKPTAEDELLS